MKYGQKRKALQYLCVNPLFDIHKITQGALRYSPNEKPVLLHNGLTSYIGTDLMDLSLFMPTREQALAVKEKFLGDPAGAYMGVLASLAGEF